MIELACVAETLDPQQGARHESYQVLNAPGGFARFSVRGEDIVGTIVLPNEVYRIASLEPTQQAVFRSSNSTQEAQRSMFARRLPPQALASTLERRHVQLERLAGIQPEFVAQSDVGRFLRIRGGKIGTISGAVTAPKLREALESLGELGNVPNGLELQVTQVASQRNGQRVAFRQVINGIAYAGENHLDIDRYGAILSLESQLYDPALAGPATLISESLAQAAAVKAIEAQIKDHLGEHELQKPTDLFFHFEPSAHSSRITIFFIRADRTDGSWLVQVNASNADARIAAKPQGD